MRITPLEIRQKTFEKTLRGYDKDEVNAFLLTLSQEWERAQDEVKEFRLKYEGAEKEVSKLREVESSLFKTLKTAEDTGANVIGQANKSAELLLRESQLKADGLMNEAKSKAKNAIEEAEMTSRQLMEEMEDQLKRMAEQYKLLELHRDNLLADVKRIAGETMDRVDRLRSGDHHFSPDQHVATSKRVARKILNPNEIEQVAQKAVEQHAVMTETKIVVMEEKFQRSFFDDIQ